jgi:glycine dehydrogenase subunit 1
LSYVPHTAEEIAVMLEQIGITRLEELFETVPSALRLQADLKLPSPLAERSLLEHLRERAAENLGGDRASRFVGAGAYDHFIPAAVDALAGRAEFTTAYTPYQAEISQGTLQAIFEFQTMICQLTGLDIANASLYDGASAAAEAALMALRVTKSKRIYLSSGLHPHYQQVIRTYLSGIDAEIERLPLGSDGRTGGADLAPDTAAVILGYPNFFGCIERVGEFAQAAHAVGALCISVTNEPLALALIRPPGELEVDIACGEAQGFGVPLSFGGPYLGFLTARDKLMRQLPGRLIGETVDTNGQRAFVMTLTTREQHIRREKATSNICTNQGLCMLRATVYMALLGRQGLRRLAEVNLSLASYARGKLEEAGLRLPYPAPTFNEFVVAAPDLSSRHAELLEKKILAGLPLGEVDPQREDQLLVCFTEMNRREEIDRLARELTA